MTAPETRKPGGNRASAARSKQNGAIVAPGELGHFAANKQLIGSPGT